MSLTPYLKHLLNSPPTFTPAHLTAVLDHILTAPFSEIQLGALLFALRKTELDHKSEYITAAVLRLLAAADQIKLPEENAGYVDIVGTGGDGHNTFNVSTTASFVCHGMGIPICKHGGKASTSSSGSGDLLAELGVNLANVNSTSAPLILSDNGYCYLFAPVFHVALGKVVRVRKELGTPTMFNILGPLLNPVKLQARVIGVYSESLGRVFAETVATMNQYQEVDSHVGAGGRALIVWGCEGLDELSPAGLSKVWEVTPAGEIKEYSVSPEDFGLPLHDLESVKSGTPAENAAIVKKLLAGELEEGNPILDYVLLNAAAVGYVSGVVSNFKEGVEKARESIKSGKALQALNGFVEASNKEW